MLAKRSRFFKLLFLIIFAKVFIILVLLCFNTYEVHKIDRPRVEIINELLIDKREAPTFMERLKLIREEMPSFPLEELLRRPNTVQKIVCAEAPDFTNIEYHNEYWQVLHNGNTTFHFFGAYYDNRKDIHNAPLVRLLSMVNVYEKKGEGKYPVTYCQLWYKDRVKPVIVEALDYKMLWVWRSRAGSMYPTLISCPVDKHMSLVPEMVSLVANKCDRAKNVLRVVYEVENETTEKYTNSLKKQRRFMICLKVVDFLYTDLSWRLIEWLELVRILGADKVVFYEGQMHPNISRVIDDYKLNNPGFVELRPMSLGRGDPHSPQHFHHFAMVADGFNRILNEMIPYNDCFYRNMYKYDYIGIFDIDEIIMPLGNVTHWNDLIDLAYKVPDYQRDSTGCKDWVSFCFRNVYFPRYAERPKVYKHLPSYYYMLQHVQRVAVHDDRYPATKCLHSTKFAIGLHNHFPLYRAKTVECKAKSIPIEYAQLQHYREPYNKTHLINPVLDDSIWRFQPKLQEKVYARYQQLGFLPKISDLEAIEEKSIENFVQYLILIFVFISLFVFLYFASVFKRLYLKHSYLI